jgi:hypothetical protein
VNGASTNHAGVDWRLALGLVLGLALLIRLWGIGYGLPFSYWTDEYHELMRAMQLGAGSFNLARTSKGGFYLLLFFEYGVYYAVLKVAGVVSSTREFAELFARDPSTFYLIGRATAALFGVMTVLAVYWLARLAYSTIAGLLAAALLAINVLHVDLSHRIGVDVPMVMFAAISLCYAVRIASNGRRRDYLLAALSAALATTTKFPGILLIVPLLISHSYATSRGNGVRGWIGSANLWLAAGLFAGVLLVTNPGIVVAPPLLGKALGTHVEEAAEIEEELDPEGELGDRPNLYLYYLDVLRDSMGWPLFALSLAAVAYAAWRRTRGDVVLLSYALVNYLAIATTASETLYYPRYALPIVIVLAVLAGRLLGGMIQALPRWRIAAGTGALALVAAWPASEAITASYTLTRTDTRTVARTWFEENVPTGAKVVVEGGKIGPKRESVQLRDSRESLERRIAYWKDVEPRQAKFLEYRLAAHEGGGHDLVFIRLQSVADFDEYVADGVEYFVVRPEYFVGSRKAESGASRLLEDLRNDPRVKQIARFAAESRTQPGPVIEIYRLETPRRSVAD